MSTAYQFSINHSGSKNFSWKSGDPILPQQMAMVTLMYPYLAFPMYEFFRLKISVNFFDSQIEWLSTTPDEIEHPASNFSTYLDFKNLDQLNTGNYNVAITYNLEGMQFGSWQHVDIRSINFSLTIQAGPQIKTEKQIYTLTYDKSNDTLSGDSLVNVLNNTEAYELFFEGDGTTFAPVSGFTDNFTLVFSSSSKFPTSGEYIIPAFLKRNDQRIWAFQIKIIIIDAPIIVSPSSLYFWVKKSSNEVKIQNLSIFNQFGKSFSITKPDWINLSHTSGNSDLTVEVSNVEPVNLDAGRYSGEIKVFYDDKSIVIPVVLDVFSFFSHNFDEDYNFCLDLKKITVFQNNQTARYVRLTATMIFRTPEETKTLVVPYTIPYYNGQISLDIGRNIHRYFLKNRTSIFEESTLIYHFDNKVHLYPCSLDLKIEELDVDFNALYEESISGKKFYPGKKPKLFPFLTNHNLRSRAFGSKVIFSFISGLVTPEELFDIPVTQNGLEPGSIARVKVEKFENKISFGNYKAVTAGGKTIGFYQFPDGKDLVNIQWENQNLCPEWVSFKGISSQSEELTHLFQDNVFSGTSEKFDTTGNKIITINTGFILKAEENLISELMYSKFCVLEIDGKFIKASPSSSKIVTQDKAKQLIEFDLEFKINGN